MKSNCQYLQILKLLLKYQQKRRMIALAFGLKADQARKSLSYTEEAALFALDDTPGINIRDLSKFLQVERSWMSRLVAGMEKKKLLKSVPSASDKRSKELQITKSGKLALKENGEILQLIMEKSLEVISEKEQKQLERFFKIFADNLNAPKSAPRSDSHPVYFQLWRISRAVGISGDHFMDTGFSVTQIQVLKAIAGREGEIVLASDLAQTLPFDMSTVSRTISEFEKNKLVSRKPLEEDKRSLVLSLTAKGLDKFQNSLSSGAKVVELGLKSLSNKEVTDLVLILEKLTQDMPTLSSSMSSKFQFKVLSPEEGKQAVGQVLDISASKLPKETIQVLSKSAFGFYHQGEVKAVAALKKHHGSEAIEHLVLFADLLEKEECLEFVQMCLAANS
ncbi:MAG: MarR family transcriptional regulator [Bdellovibrionota bacterium]